MLEENIEREEKLWLRNKDEERKEESRFEEKSRTDKIEIRCKVRMKERKKVKAKIHLWKMFMWQIICIVGMSNG